MPLVSVLLAVHDDAPYLELAIRSVLLQTLRDLELIVVDDASVDATPELLAAVDDERLVLLRNHERLGLAASLNRGLDQASGRFVARMDADDVAMPNRLESQLRRLRACLSTGIVGTGVLDVDESGRPGPAHRMPTGSSSLRWHSLFSAPFFHPTVVVDRQLLESHGLRYDSAYLESEDYDLWCRLLSFTEGDNLQQPLVLKRVHSGQASAVRGDVQASFQRRVALREIERLAPDLPAAETAWKLGSGRPFPDVTGEAADAYLALLEAFERRHGVDRSVREAAARTLARRGFPQRALALAPAFPIGASAARARRALESRRLGERASAWLARLQGQTDVLRVAVVSPEPTPYRAPLFDRIAARDDVELTVVYASRTVADRTWEVEIAHHAVFLSGVDVPAARRLLRHDYPVTLGIARALRESRPAVVVVSGWSTFASQSAIAWCRAHRIPYVLLVESHDLGPRASWRRAVKGVLVPRLVAGAAGILAVGGAARESMLARGAKPEAVRIFANTIDVPGWIERADRLAVQARDGSRGVPSGTVVLSVARLVPEKGLDILVRAAAGADVEGLRLVVVGDGPQRQALADLASSVGVDLTLVGVLGGDALAELYVRADVFALLSLHEPWGVVVNEASASGLPLVLSDRVGAAYDLLVDGENGILVAGGDVDAAASALRRLALDPGLRGRTGKRSREIVRAWSYESSVEGFVAAVRDATSR